MVLSGLERNKGLLQVLAEGVLLQRYLTRGSRTIVDCRLPLRGTLTWFVKPAFPPRLVQRQNPCNLPRTLALIRCQVDVPTREGMTFWNLGVLKGSGLANRVGRVHQDGVIAFRKPCYCREATAKPRLSGVGFRVDVMGFGVGFGLRVL